LVAISVISAYIGKVLGKGVGTFISSTALPVGSKVLPARFDYFPHVIDMLLGVEGQRMEPLLVF